DNFFNGAIFRRPGREFYFDPTYLTARSRWAGETYSELGPDARLNCGLRYFARDVGHQVSQRPRWMTSSSRENQFAQASPIVPEPNEEKQDASNLADDLFSGFYARAE